MELGFIHRFIPASDPATKVTLLLLHGTGGDESDLLPLGQALAPGAAILSPRGKVLENGMPRFFRRLSEGVFDVEDVKLRARELAGFVRSASDGYRLDPETVVAVGYSNGANIAAALLLLEPGVLRRAILLHAMVPLQPENPPNLAGAAIFMGAGRHDPIVAPAGTEKLAGMLRDAGAQVSLHWTNGGHALAAEEITAARAWLGNSERAEAHGESL